MFSKKIIFACGLSLFAFTNVEALTINQKHFAETVEDSTQNGEVFIGTNGETSWQIRPTETTTFTTTTTVVEEQEQTQKPEEGTIEMGDGVLNDLVLQSLLEQFAGSQDPALATSPTTSPAEEFDFSSFLPGIQNFETQVTTLQNGVEIQLQVSGTFTLEPTVAAQECSQQKPDQIVPISQESISVLPIVHPVETVAPVVEESISVQPIVHPIETVAPVVEESISVQPIVHPAEAVPEEIQILPTVHPFEEVTSVISQEEIQVQPIVHSFDEATPVAVEAVNVQPVSSTQPAPVETFDGIDPSREEPVNVSQTQPSDETDPISEDPVVVTPTTFTTVDMH